MATANHTPIDAATRGRLKQWKAGLTTRYVRFNRQWMTDATTRTVVAFCAKTGIGRRRAFDKLQAAIAPSGAVLECVRMDGNHPLAVWSILKPRVAVRIDAAHPADMQDCVVVDYALVGLIDRQAIRGDGLWSLEIPDHALGRAMQRSSLSPETIIRDAHHAVLRVRTALVLPGFNLTTASAFLLRAGDGAFVCDLALGRDRSPDMEEQHSIHVRAHTFLDTDQLRDDQHPFADDGVPGDRLGDGWLLPAPLRQFVADEGLLHIEAWAPGMPETLAMPAGRA